MDKVRHRSVGGGSGAPGGSSSSAAARRRGAGNVAGSGPDGATDELRREAARKQRPCSIELAAITMVVAILSLLVGYQLGLQSMDRIAAPNTDIDPDNFQLCEQALPLLRRALVESNVDETHHETLERIKRAFDDALYHFEQGGFAEEEEEPGAAGGYDSGALAGGGGNKQSSSPPPPVKKQEAQPQQQQQQQQQQQEQGGRKRVAVAVSILEGKTDKTGLTEKVFQQYDRYVDSAGVMAESVRQSMKDSKFDVDLIAFIMRRDYLRRYHGKLKAFGFQVIEAESPVLYDEIAPSYYKDELNKSGCCGMSELLKLNALTLTQYHRVMLVDADVIVLQNVDELLDMPPEIGLIYTNGTMEGEIYQGGMWIVRPNITILEGMKSLIRKGAWYKGTAWEGTGIGWLYGGPTIQGLIPFWYWKKEGVGRYKENAPPCTDTPLEDRKIFHFTACPKPFECVYIKEKKGCAHAFESWWRFSGLLEERIGHPKRKICTVHGQYKPLVISDKKK